MCPPHRRRSRRNLLLRRPPAPAPCCTVLGGTLITISIDRALDSRTAQIGEEFPIHLAEPLVQADTILIPAGTPGVGEVIHVTGSGLMGRPGELSVVVRHLPLDGRNGSLRGFQPGGADQQNTDLARAVNATIGIVGIFISGGGAGGLIGCLVREGEGADEKHLSKLTGNRYFIRLATPGVHKYWVKSEATDRLTMEAEPGETYFVKCTIAMGIIVGRPNLSPSDLAEFQKKGKKVKPMAPAEAAKGKKN